MKKLLVCGICVEEYLMISACEIPKNICASLNTAHEGNIEVKNDIS